MCFYVSYDYLERKNLDIPTGIAKLWGQNPPKKNYDSEKNPVLKSSDSSDKNFMKFVLKNREKIIAL